MKALGMDGEAFEVVQDGEGGLLMSMERTAVGHLELGARGCGTQPQPPSRPNLLLKRRDCRRRWFMLLALTISINAGSVPWHPEIRGRLEALDSKKRHG